MGLLGLPNISVIFKALAFNAIARSQKGIALLIIKDDTGTFDFVEYKNVSEIDEAEAAKFTEANLSLIKQCFLGKPAKVIVARLDSEGTLSALLTKVLIKKFNWIGLAEGTTVEQDQLAAWVKDTNESLKKSFKAIVHNATTTDDMHIVNFKNANVKQVGKAAITGDKYVSRLLGLLAGLPFTQSATYYVLSDLESVDDVADINAAIGAGGFVLFNDEEVVRVGRAVNSLVTLVGSMNDEMKKITIVEAMDLMRADIIETFKNHYVGKFKNVYDNQILFLSAVNTYFRELAAQEILDINAKNLAEIDVESQRQAWIASGKTEAEAWDDLTVKINTFRSNLFLGGNVKILDAIEDLDFNINM